MEKWKRRSLRNTSAFGDYSPSLYSLEHAVASCGFHHVFG